MRWLSPPKVTKKQIGLLVDNEPFLPKRLYSTHVVSTIHCQDNGCPLCAMGHAPVEWKSVYTWIWVRKRLAWTDGEAKAVWAYIFQLRSVPFDPGWDWESFTFEQAVTGEQ